MNLNGYPVLIMVMGLPGSGKTYFSNAFAKAIGGVHINSDIIRKRLMEKPAYSPEDKDKIYKGMYEEVTRALLQGQPVIVDATFSLENYRAPYFRFATENQIPCRIILTEAQEDIIASRLQHKRPDSDADYEVYKKIKSEFQTLGKMHLELRTDQLTLTEMTELGIDFIKAVNYEGTSDT